MDNGEEDTEDEDSENFIKPAITNGSFIETGQDDFQDEDSLDPCLYPSDRTAEEKKRLYEVMQRFLKEPQPYYPPRVVPFRRSGSRPNIFSPEEDPLSFITQIDELLKEEEKLMAAKKVVQQCARNIFKRNGVMPLIRDGEFRGSEHHMQAIEAYHELKKLILEPGAQEKPDWEWYIASLEAIGAILLNPELLGNMKYYDGREQTFPHINTFYFTTNRTRSMVEKIIWDDGVSFIWTQRTLHHLTRKPP